MASRHRGDRDKNGVFVTVWGIEVNFADVSTNIDCNICMAPLIDRHHLTQSVGGSRQFRGMCEENNANQIVKTDLCSCCHTQIQFSVFSFQSLEIYSFLIRRIRIIRGSKSSHFLKGCDSRIDYSIPWICLFSSVFDQKSSLFFSVPVFLYACKPVSLCACKPVCLCGESCLPGTIPVRMPETEIDTACSVSRINRSAGVCDRADVSFFEPLGQLGFPSVQWFSVKRDS